MRLYTYILSAFLLLVSLAGCRHSEGDQEHLHASGGEHAHGSESEGDHGHAHGPEIRLDTTIWTDKTELFVEFPPLVVGQASDFAAHYTVLKGYKPVTKGKLTVSLIKGKKGIRTVTDAPSSPGIFTPVLQPKEAGLHTLIFDLNSPQVSERLVLPNIKVYANEQQAQEDFTPQEEGKYISFLKEQAWKMEFATAPVRKDTVYEVISTSGSWVSVPQNERMVNAQAEGIVVYPKLLAEGMPVRKGEVLMSITGSGMVGKNFETQLSIAHAAFKQAQAEYERNKELYDKEVIAKSEWEEVQMHYQIAKAEYEALVKDYTRSGKQIKAPQSGFVKELYVRNGDFVSAGKPLITVGDNQEMMLEVEVSPRYKQKLPFIQELAFTDLSSQWQHIKKANEKLVSIGNALEPGKHHLIPVFFRLNAVEDLMEGSMSEVRLSVGHGESGLLVPKEALLEDFGKYSVIVQHNGESYEQRNVRIGRSNGKEVEILEGLSEGERVVTKGVYQVKMASMSGQVPGHGHAH
jgi:membrane fusion protein, heavy metal efflux system